MRLSKGSVTRITVIVLICLFVQIALILSLENVTEIDLGSGDSSISTTLIAKGDYVKIKSKQDIELEIIREMPFRQEIKAGETVKIGTIKGEEFSIRGLNIQDNEMINLGVTGVKLKETKDGIE